MNKKLIITIAMVSVACIVGLSYQLLSKDTTVAVERESTIPSTEIIECTEKPEPTVVEPEENKMIDLGNLEGKYSNELISQSNFVLMISNQSFYEDSVELSINIDDELLVQETYLVEDQHTYLYYYLNLELGEHEISIQYDTKVLGEETIKLEEDKTKWLAIDYWRTKEEGGSVSFYQSNEPIMIR